MATKNKFQLKKNIGKELPAILGRTGANLAGYTVGTAVNKNLGQAKPMVKGLGMLFGGIALQLVDNGYAEAGGYGLSAAGYSVLMGDVSAKVRAKTKEGEKNTLLDILSKTGLAGTADEMPGVDWEEAYRQAAEEGAYEGAPETDGDDYPEEPYYAPDQEAEPEAGGEVALEGVETNKLFI